MEGCPFIWGFKLLFFLARFLLSIDKYSFKQVVLSGFSKEERALEILELGLKATRQVIFQEVEIRGNLPH